MPLRPKPVVTVAVAAIALAPLPEAHGQDASGRDEAACGEAAPTSGVLTGEVRDRTTGLPLPGSSVTLTLRADSGTVRHRTRAGSGGTFAFCGIAAGGSDTVEGAVVARRGSRSSTTVPVRLAAGDRERHALEIPLGAPGRLVGRVVSRDGGDPVSGATVSLPGLEVGAVTDGDGRFTLSDLPPGLYALQVEHLAYRARVDSVRVRPRRSVHLRISAATEPVEVDPVTVRVEGVRSAHLEAQGFYRRRERGGGEYITRQEILERDPARLSHLFRRMAGVQVRGGQLTMRRAHTSLTNFRKCRLQYIINGQAAQLPMGVDTFLPADVLAIEVYRGPSELPAVFDEGRAACGAVVIWLRVQR